MSSLHDRLMYGEKVDDGNVSEDWDEIRNELSSWENGRTQAKTRPNMVPDSLDFSFRTLAECIGAQGFMIREGRGEELLYIVESQMGAIETPSRGSGREPTKTKFDYQIRERGSSSSIILSSRGAITYDRIVAREY